MNYIEKIIIDDAKNHRITALIDSFKENPKQVVDTLNEYYPNFLYSYFEDTSFLNLKPYESFYCELVENGYIYDYVSPKLNIQKDLLLLKCAGYGLVDFMKTLISLGLNPNTKDDFEMDCFHNACINNQLTVAQYLYDNTTVDLKSINFIGDNLFLSAVRYAQLNTLQYLDSIGVDINYVNVARDNQSENQDALFLAVRENNHEIVQYLLTHPNYQLNSLEQCIKHAKKRELSVLDLLLEHKTILDEKTHFENTIEYDNLKKKVKI